MTRGNNVAKTPTQPAADLTVTNPTVLADVIETARLPTKDTAKLSDEERQQHIRGLNMIEVFGERMAEATKGAKIKDPNLFEIIQKRIDELDDLIATRLNVELHKPEFQKLEGTWRGLHYLVFNTETSTRLKLRVLDVTEKEMSDDLEKALDFDQSALFKKIYEEEYGTLGGKPYGCLVADIAVDRSPRSQKLLKNLASVASAAHAPLIAAADATLFDLESFEDLPRPRDLAKIFESSDMAEWRAFRDSEESRYVTLTLPRVLMRLPYHPVDNPVDGLSFKENVGIEYDGDQRVFPRPEPEVAGLEARQAGEGEPTVEAKTPEEVWEREEARIALLPETQKAAAQRTLNEVKEAAQAEWTKEEEKIANLPEAARPAEQEKLKDVKLAAAQRKLDEARTIPTQAQNVTATVPVVPKKTVDLTQLALEPKAGLYLWGNPAFVLAQRITAAFAMYSWTAAIRGVEGGGKVEGLPLHKFKSLNGDKAMIVPTEVSITDRREKELSDLGFVSLVYCKDTNYAAFFGSQTVNKPKKYNLQSANSNAELSARLPYILNTSRFAHYIKVMMRNRVGSFMTKENVQTYLTTWISDYVLDKDDAGQELKAKYPLREARIDVSDVPGQPGSYSATVFLRPHFQLEGLSASLRLVAELPAAAA
jgi:predicted component of type VI protein secretion system